MADATNIDLDKSAKAVSNKLHKAWRKERRFVHIRGLCHVLVWAVVLILLDFVIDWRLDLPGWARLLLLGLNLATLAWVGNFRWWRLLYRYDALRMALQVERLHPELKSLLVSYVQFRQGAGEMSSASPALIRAVELEATKATEPIDFRQIINYRELKRIFIFSVAVLLFFIATSVQGSNYIRVLVARMINPSAATAYPTRTWLVEYSRDLPVQIGSPVELHAQVGGYIPDEAKFCFKTKNSGWEKITVSRGQSADTFVYRMDAVNQDFEYYFLVGDAKWLRPCKVTVVPPPRVLDPEITLKYPPYMNLKDDVAHTFTLNVPQGTVITWRLKTDQPLKAAQLVRDADKMVSMTVEQSGGVAVASVTADASFPYSFKWQLRDHPFDYAEEVRYFVQVTPDAPPDVTLQSPDKDRKVTTAYKANLLFSAKDDHGLNESAIAFSVNEGAPQRVALGPLTGRQKDNVTGSWAIKDSIPNLKEGDVVSFWIEVTDNRTGTPVPGKSPMRTLQVVSREDYLKFIADEHARSLADLQPLHTQEQEASKAINTIKGGSEGTTTAPANGEASPTSASAPAGGN